MSLRNRIFRVDDDLWKAALAKAADRRKQGHKETVSDVLRRALERYVKRP